MTTISNVQSAFRLKFRSKQIALAAGLLWLTFAFKPFFLIFSIFEGELQFQFIAFGIPVILIAIDTVIAVQVLRGKNWARVLVSLLSLYSCSSLLDMANEDAISQAIISIRSIIQKLAIGLLYIGPSASLFRSKSRINGVSVD